MDVGGSYSCHAGLMHSHVEGVSSQVMDAVISEVNKLGLFAQCGPFRVFVSKASLPPAYAFQVSKHCALSILSGEPPTGDCEVVELPQ